MKNSKISLGLIGVLALFLHVDTALAAMAGQVQFVNGDVQITDSFGRGHALHKGDAVNEGDTITSAKAASAQIRMQDGGFIAVRADTKIKFDSFKFSGRESGKESSTDNSFFSLFKGGFRAITGLIGRVNKQNYKITTPAATIGIRGTDHETIFVPNDMPGVSAGAYSKVNVGETTLTTDAGTVSVKPNQMGYAGGLNQAPKLQPVNVNIFTVAAAPAKEAKKEGGKSEEQKQAAQSDRRNDKGSKPESASAGTAKASGEPAEVRATAAVDNTGTTVSASAAAAPAATAPPASSAAVAPPPVTQTVVPVTLVDPTGTTLNVTSQTLTNSSGQTTTIQNGIYDAQAQLAADAANAAANAAQTAATAAGQVQTALTAIAQVSTNPASTAIAAANTAISTASPLVSSATALTSLNATTNAAAVQSTANAAAAQAAAAQTAITNNGALADSSAIAANGLINTPTTGAAAQVQSANALVQSAAATVATQNTALVTAQSAASGALSSASTTVSVASGAFTNATTQNAAIVSAQTAATALAAQAQTALTAAQAAASAAQAAAAQAATMQAAGDFTGAAAQAAIALQQQTVAQQQLTIAQNAKTTLDTQLAAAQAAQTAAGNAVSNAAVAANSAATSAAAAQTQAAAAQTAGTNAAAALAQTVAASAGTPANAVQTQAAIVAANAPVAAYHNPVQGNYFASGLLPLPAAGGLVEGNGSNNLNVGLQPNNKFVFDGSGNLVEARSMHYGEAAYGTTTVAFNTAAITPIASADVKWSGGTAFDAYQLPDGSVYIGRWQGGSVSVSDNSSVVAPFTHTLGTNSSQWMVTLAPPVNYVQSLIGTTSYTRMAATAPTDSFGNVGVLNSASLSADFTNHLVSAAVNLTINNKTLDMLAPSMAISGAQFYAPLLSASCTGTGCIGSYQGELGGYFSGNAAASAGLHYGIWPAAAALADQDKIDGVAAFSTTAAPTVGPYAAYSPARTEIALAFPKNSGGKDWENFLVATADMSNFPPVANGASSFTEQPIGGDGGTRIFNVLGGLTPLAGTVASFATTGIQMGRWSSISAQEITRSNALGGSNGDARNWMYGPQGYLDPGIAASGGQMYGTFSYVLDGNTAPHDRQSGRDGVLDSAYISANFTNNTVSANLALHVGGLAWSASATNVSLGAGQFYAASGTSNNLLVNMGTAASPLAAVACPTCSGRLGGAFTDQNFAGAILSYNLWDNGNSGGDISGNAAFVRTGTAVTNGTAAATGKYFVADHGGNVQMMDAIGTTGGVLTSYSYGNPANPANGYGSTTVSCTTCSSTAASNATAVAAPTGIYFGSWDAGTYTNMSGGGIGAASLGWITGPEAGPLFLTNALVGSKTFAFDGGMVTNSNGVAGTVLGSTALTVDFTKQVVGINIDLSINDTATTVALHSWNAKTLPGNEAPINGGKGIGGAAFQASSYSNNSGPGLLTVTVDGTTSGSGSVSGQLSGAGLNGAILSYDLGATLSNPEKVNGVAAFVGSTSDVATPHREVLMSATDPNAIVNTPTLGFYANAPARMADDGAGNLTKFDMNTINNKNNDSAMTLAVGTAVKANAGSDPVSGISWGRWDGGSVDAVKRATAALTATPLPGSLHWIAGPTETAAVTLPVSGTFAYAYAGGTAPTDNLSNVGTLNSATLSANFTAQTVDVGVNATVAGATLNANAVGAPIIQRTAFYADSQAFAAGAPGKLTVTCTGTCGASQQGTVVGAFTGAGASGAMMSYGLQNISTTGTQVISGVAGFHR